MMSVDIGIPTYRRPDGLLRAVESAVRQREGGLTIRIFVVNNDPGGAPLAVRDGHGIEVITNPVNVGPLGNWNRVIELARAPALVILHDDDELLPGAVRRAAERLASSPACGMCFSASEIMNERRETTRLIRPYGETREFLGAAGARTLLRAFVPIRTPAVMYRLDALRAAGGYPAPCAEVADIGLYMRLVLNGGAVYEPAPGARYYFDAGNLTHSVMFRVRDLELFAQVRELLAGDAAAAGMSRPEWGRAIDRMAARHALLGALYRLKCGDRVTASALLKAVLRGFGMRAGRYWAAAACVRALDMVGSGAGLYDLLREVQTRIGRSPRNAAGA